MRSYLNVFSFVDWKFARKCLILSVGILVSVTALETRLSAENAEKNEPKVIPTISSPANNAEVKSRTPTFQGVAAPAATIELFIDGVPQGRVQADAAGNWLFEVKEASSELENGTHKVRIVVRGPGGEFKSTSVPITIHVSSS